MITFHKSNFHHMAGLSAVAGILKQRVQHIYNFPLDCHGFHAVDAVTTLVRAGLAMDEEEAVAIGQSLERVGIIKNMKGEEIFADTRQFYSFMGPHSYREDEDYESNDTWAVEVDKANDLLWSKLETKDHKYLTRTYNDTFLGSEVVSLLLESGFSSSREDALLLGRAVAHACSLFRHVTNAHILEDKELFYVFNQLTRHMASCSDTSQICPSPIGMLGIEV
ncbi:MAG: hypothetical protein SGBAC_005739 [Bacillariaceae sp.]